ncbi:MAG: fibronectin type III domain-containing protein [Owenweeksia sp.]|nr:fibronectin type III domain-containing protein [Owenweeksia sp.]
MTITGQQQTSETAPWQEQIVDLSNYANDSIRARITAHHTGFGFSANLCLDDFWIGESPSCPRPSNIQVTTSTTNSISISWTTGGATNWLVGYRLSGSGGPLTILPAGTNPFTINGLNSSSTYDIYVKDSCAAGDVSLWEGAEIGTTLCGVVTAPWTEDFDGSSWVSGIGAQNNNNQVDQCWSRPSLV